jgi:hypothetical protein
METLSAVWKFLNDNAGALGLLVVVLPLGWSVWEYLRLKRRDLRQETFQTYHNLIKLLVERENQDVPKMLDRQTAIVFELRNFKEYYPVSLRILSGLREDWKDYGPPEKRSRLLAEIDETISFIKLRTKAKA